MIINKAYKLRIYPNKLQQEQIDKTIGSARFVYNYFLNFKINEYKDNKNDDTKKSSYSFFDINKICNQLKKQDDYIWLKDVDKFALNNSLKDLDIAYKNFFKQGNGFPKFKSKYKCKMSYKTTFTNNNIELNLEDNKIKLPKLKWIRFRDKRDLSNITKIINCTISKTKTGKYYASLCVEEDVMHKEFDGSIIGIDLGLKEFAITSDNEFIENPKFLRKSEIKLKKLQRSLSRKQKGSNNYKKARLKFAKQHEKIANQRRYWINVLSTRLINENQVISLETLKSSNLMKNHKLAKSIADVSWFEFTRQLLYKGLWNNRNIIKIDQFFPSSQLCSNCGNKSSQTKDLSVRTYKCESCGLEIDRDLNASINIREEGLRLLLT